MTQSTIDIPGLPEGWKAVAYRKPIVGEFCWEEEQVYKAVASITPCLIIEKIQPRRIVPDDSETQIALMEGAMNSAADGYFGARPQLNNTHNLRIFEAGFRRAWKEVKE